MTSMKPSTRGAAPFWRQSALGAIAAVVAAPVIAVLVAAAGGGLDGALGHVWSTRGPLYLAGTIFLCAFVAIGAGAIGVACAALTALADFPGRRLLSVALALPFAVPAYVTAYAYADLLSPFGAISGLLGAAHAPNIRNLPGAAFILSLATYPYVYLALRASLAGRSDAMLECARNLGAGPFEAVRRVLIGASRPALIGGLALALMETAAEFGVADYFGVPTLSVGIFRTWYGLNDLGAATQIAAALFFVALILVLMEEAGRRGRTHDSVRATRANARMKLRGAAAAAAFIACLTPIVLGFGAPVAVLVAGALSPDAASPLKIAAVAGNTLFVAAGGAIIAIIAAIAVIYVVRGQSRLLIRILARIVTFGYALPGAVLAIGVLALSTGVAGVAAGGVGLLLYAYVTRFLTAAYNTIGAGFEQISIQMDESARMLGATGATIAARIHAPLARGAVLTGGAIVAIDIAKELPATLLLRPFNFETLATSIYRLASDERLAAAAPAALLLIAVSLAPTLGLAIFVERRVSR